MNSVTEGSFAYPGRIGGRYAGPSRKSFHVPPFAKPVGFCETCGKAILWMFGSKVWSSCIVTHHAPICKECLAIEGFVVVAPADTSRASRFRNANLA